MFFFCVYVRMESPAIEYETSCSLEKSRAWKSISNISPHVNDRA
jgi:hypothetical protein